MWWSFLRSKLPHKPNKSHNENYKTLLWISILAIFIVVLFLFLLVFFFKKFNICNKLIFNKFVLFRSNLPRSLFFYAAKWEKSLITALDSFKLILYGEHSTYWQPQFWPLVCGTTCVYCKVALAAPSFKNLKNFVIVPWSYFKIKRLTKNFNF